MRLRLWITLAAVAAMSLAAGGCRGRPAAAPLPVRPWFIALERDFQGFRDWLALELPDARAQGTTHPAGKQRAYVNALPSPGSRAFPIGTMIVKDVDGAVPADSHLFAMVKRGGGFNGQGAKGWEWFELKERADDSVGILWRGLGAPRGESYGGDPLGTCNSCHDMSAGNDYVRSPSLALEHNRQQTR